jgi:hypothetical protein
MKIASTPSTSNPRFLRTLLDDIALFGDFDQLNKRIDQDLRAPDVAVLYGIVLARCGT